MRVKAVIEYDGAPFAGWQIQPNAPTVQAELERALEIATGVTVRVEGAGRTDSGVHAEGQVAAFDLPEGADLFRLRASLNGLADRAVAVVSLEAAPDDFDPRRQARARTYKYTIVHGRPRSPLWAARCWHISDRLDTTLLQSLAEEVAGSHDFSAFRASDCEAASTVRTVSLSCWHEDGNVLCYEIASQAFLKQMVRVLVGSMVDVARGRLDRATFSRLLDGGDRRESGRTAPAKGLVLVRIAY